MSTFNTKVARVLDVLYENKMNIVGGTILMLAIYHHLVIFAGAPTWPDIKRSIWGNKKCEQKRN